MWCSYFSFNLQHVTELWQNLCPVACRTCWLHQFWTCKCLYEDDRRTSHFKLTMKYTHKGSKKLHFYTKTLVWLCYNYSSMFWKQIYKSKTQIFFLCALVYNIRSSNLLYITSWKYACFIVKFSLPPSTFHFSC